MATTNLGLHAYSTAETAAQWCAALNSDNEKLDSLVNVLQSGNNSQLRYQKYSDGTLHMWGFVDLGTTYPCTHQTAFGFASDRLTLTFPVSCAATDYSFVAHLSATVYPDTFVTVAERKADSVGINLTCPLNDATVGNSKGLSVDIWGRWK